MEMMPPQKLAQVATVLVMLALFTGAVFFPREMVPEALAGVVDFNPITWPVEATRAALLHGQGPDPATWGIYALAAAVALAVGLKLFGTLRRGFADVL